MRVEIKFETDEEILDVIYGALANGGLTELGHCSVRLDVSDEDYNKARTECNAPSSIMGAFETLCFEDVLIQILRSGKKLMFKDYESDENISFDLKQAKQYLKETGISDELLQIVNEEDDAITGFNILQWCLYKEKIYC